MDLSVEDEDVSPPFVSLYTPFGPFISSVIKLLLESPGSEREYCELYAIRNLLEVKIYTPKT